MTTLERIVRLYQQVAELTKPLCQGVVKHGCKVPYSCCSSEYCELAIEHAKERHGVQLERTQHPTLPLMGATGCTAEPHLRPLCTLHVCSLSRVTCGSMATTEVYFKLREEISELEFEWSEQEGNQFPVEQL